jgi:two-component system, NarL family, sensor histidine kinase DesK
VTEGITGVGHGSDTVADVQLASRVRPRNRYGWAWALIWLFYLFQPATLAWRIADPMRRWISISALLAFAACFIVAFVWARLQPGAGRTRGPALGAILTGTAAALVVVMTVILDRHSLALFVYVGVMAIFLLPGRWGPASVVALIVGTLITQQLVPHWQADYSIEFQIFVASMAMWGVQQIIQRNRELAAAREEITRLAVSNERNRFARDLHDILGHSLTVVAVKAELAGRFVHSDPGRAEAEISDVQRLSRQALAEVRTAVAGFRDVTLASELVNARSALTAAGIDADLPTAIDEVPAAHRELFGWVVREGVTNVVRHSGASSCRVRIAPSEVEISDDGRPAQQSPGAGPVSGHSHGPNGHGLAGLRERAEALGGSLSVRRVADGGFALTVRV